jgi:hypothetical protein
MRLLGLFGVLLFLSTPTQTHSPEREATAPLPSVTLPAEFDRVLRRTWTTPTNGPRDESLFTFCS